MPVRVGVQVQPQHSDFASMRDTWRELDELGADMIFTWDHFYPLYGEPDGKRWEGLTSLACLAQVTERAQVGALVFCNSYRNPELLADAHCTIDHISGGRVILGIGAGWFERDYDEYGYEFGTAPDRLRALRRDIPRMKERMGKLNPAPQHDIPILVGGSGPKVTLRLIAEHAQYWHGFGGVDEYLAKAEILAGHCADVGRDPAEIVHTRGVMRGTLEAADGLYEAGVGVVTIGIGGDGSGYDIGPVRELLAWRDRINAGG